MREHAYALGSSAQDVNVKRCTPFASTCLFVEVLILRILQWDSLYSHVRLKFETPIAALGKIEGYIMKIAKYI